MMPARYVLTRGDGIPNFVLPDVVGQPTGPAIHSRGNPLACVFSLRDHDDNLRPFAQAAERLKGIDLFVVTPLSPADNLALAHGVVLPWGCCRIPPAR